MRRGLRPAVPGFVEIKPLRNYWFYPAGGGPSLHYNRQTFHFHPCTKYMGKIQIYLKDKSRSIGFLQESLTTEDEESGSLRNVGNQ